MEFNLDKETALFNKKRDKLTTKFSTKILMHVVAEENSIEESDKAIEAIKESKTKAYKFLQNADELLKSIN